MKVGGEIVEYCMTCVSRNITCAVNGWVGAYCWYETYQNTGNKLGGSSKKGWMYFRVHLITVTSICFSI